jgi:hypothetical protein
MITIVIGRRTRGKSTLAYAIALQRNNRVIFDPRRQFHTTDDIVYEPDELYDMLDTRSEIIVQPNGDLRSNFERTCYDFYDWTDDNRLAGIAFLVDEARFLDTPNNDYPNFDRILRFCKPQDVDVILTCHRPVDVSVDIRAIADYWCIFQTTQEHDLAIIYSRCGQDCADVARNLRDKQFVLWNDGDGNFTVKSEPASWYVPIERTVSHVG